MPAAVPVRDLIDESGAAQAPPAHPPVADPLRAIRVLRRWVRLGVYAALLAEEPLYLFVLGFSFQQALLDVATGFLIAIIAVEGAFGQVFKQRKRSAYPSELVMGVGAAPDLAAAPGRALALLDRLLDVRAAFLAPLDSEGNLVLESVSGMTRQDAQALLDAGVAEESAAMNDQTPVSLDPADIPAAAQAVRRGERIVFVPVVALKRTTGMLGLVAPRRNADIGDRELLGGIGAALGLALENLRQRDDLRTREQRLRTIISAAPMAIFAVDSDGLFTIVEGKALDAMGVSPRDLVGRSVFEVYSDDAAILSDFRKALAGEEVSASRAVAGVVLEARLTPVFSEDGGVAGVIGLAWDVTERTQAENALRESEQLLRGVVSNVPVVIFAVDREGIITLSEGKGLEALGRKPAETVGHPVFTAHAEPRIHDHIRRALAGEAFTAVVELGGLVWETWYSPMRDANGAVTGIIGVAADITERRRSEAALRDSEELYRTLVETFPDAVVLTDQAGVVVKANQKAAQLMGFARPEQMAGIKAVDFLAEQHGGQMAEADLALVHESGIVHDREYTIVRRDGTLVPVEISLSTLADSGGHMAGFVGVVRDITERQHVERALRQSEEKYRDLVENTNEVIYTLNQTGVITYVSPVVEQVGGYKPADLVGQSFTTVIHPADLPGIMQSFQRVIAGVLEPSEYRLKTSSGDYRWVRSSSRPVYDEEGKPIGVRGLLWDITERKTAEDALRAIAEGTASATGDEFFLSLSRHLAAALRVRFAFIGELVNGSGDKVRTLAVWAGDRYADNFQYDLRGTPCENVVGQTLRYYPSDVQRLFPADGLLGEMSVESYLGMPLFDSVGRALGILVVMDDKKLEVSPSAESVMSIFAARAGAEIERKRAGDALSASEERYRNVFEAARDVIYTLGRDGTLTSLNPAFETITGWTCAEWIGKSFVPLVHPDDLGMSLDYFRRILGGGETVFYELRILTKSGEWVVGEFTSTPLVEDGSITGVLGFARDITERKKAEKMIRQLAYHDALTGLPNRALFEDRLRLALAQAHRSGQLLAVMFLDLDHFKLVNDTLGHTDGDKLLQAVAQELVELVREGDTVARVGGDEFTLLLPAINQPDDAVEIAERILQRLKQPRLLGGQEFRTTTSIGVTVYPQDGADPETLLRNADTAMYRAKDVGRDNYQRFTAAMNVNIMERLALERDFRHAVERGELVLHYQPLADVATGRITGAEALVRWRHPTRGLVLPDDFIPMAEETGLILPMGEWVLRTACKQNRAWQDAGCAPMRVTVNLSARQLQEDSLVANVARVLDESGLAPEYLELEITEGAVMSNLEFIIRMLQDLREMGVGIAVDDFGTGYSSLSYLKRFPINSVKIDRSFVRDLATDPNDAAIVTTIIAMARSLSLKVIAEGVETQEQLRFLKRWGCDEFQGFLLSKAVPAAALTRLMAKMSRPRAKIVRLKSA